MFAEREGVMLEEGAGREDIGVDAILIQINAIFRIVSGVDTLAEKPFFLVKLQRPEIRGSS